MRFKAIYYIFLAWTAIALASDSSEPIQRPPRHLHQIKEMIVNKLFGASNCTQSQPEQPEIKFYQIPGFDNVVIKAVPKTPTEELPQIVENIPPNSQIGIIGSYLGTNSLNDTFNALQGVKNLQQSGILGGNQGAIDELTLLKPTSAQNIAFAQRNPVTPCSTPGLINTVPLDPIRVLVAPPKVPKLVPTQDSYKQVNQDGSLTTYTSSLDLQNGVKVTEDGKTVPFFVDRIRKIPVRLPVPVLPEVSKIIVSNPFDVTYGRYPMDVTYPGSSYSYKQLYHDGRFTTYSDLPSMNGKYDGPVVVTEMDRAIPPPPIFLKDRIEKVAATASYPKAPLIQPTPMMTDVPAGQVFYNEPPLVSRVPVSGPGKYSYTQTYNNQQNDGDEISKSASGIMESFVNNPAVFATEHKLPSPPVHQFSNFPANNPFKPPGSSGFSYNQVYSDGKMASFTGSGLQEYAGVHVIAPASNSFSYKQVGNGKMTTYTGAGIAEEGSSPTVMVRAVNHPMPPPHIADRIEKVVAGAKFNRPPLSTMLLGNPFPVPTGFMRIPSVHNSLPQQPVRVPSTSGMSPFVYKHIHRDGSMSSFGGDGAVTAGVKSQAPNMGMLMPPGYHRVFESPINTGPFPMQVNPNAVKPSTPVSGSYSYKLINNGPVNIQEGQMDEYQNNITPPDVPVRSNQPFPVLPPMSMMPAPVQGCVDPEIVNPNIAPSPIVFQEPVIPLSYTYKQISHNKPGEFLVVKVEDPLRDMKKVHERLQKNQVSQQYANGFPSGEVYQNLSNYFAPPSSNLPAPSVPQVSQETTPPSSFSFKQVTNEGVYEYSNADSAGVKTNKTMENPRDNLASNEKTPSKIESNSPILNNRNALTNNPIVVPEETYYYFKQSNMDGSSITVKDNGQNSLSVDFEPPKSDSSQGQEPLSFDIEEEEKASSSSHVQEHAAPTGSEPSQEPPKTETSSRRPMVRRRKIKRVIKPRGDIPEAES